MMTRQYHRRRSPESSRRRRKERRGSREQLQSQQIRETAFAPAPYEMRYDATNTRLRTFSSSDSSSSSSSTTSSSLLNISNEHPNKFGLRSFFSGSDKKNRRVRKKRSRRMFRFNNSSSSSVGSDLAYGRGYIDRRRNRDLRSPTGHRSSRRAESDPMWPSPPKRAQTDEEIIELRRKIAEIARQQTREDLRLSSRHRPLQLVGAAAALSQSHRPHSGGLELGIGSSKLTHKSSSDDSEWESASEDESSNDSDAGLAYGSALHLPSGSSKPARVSNTSYRGQRLDFDRPSLNRKPSLVDPRLFGPVNSLRGIVNTPCGFDKVDRRNVGDRCDPSIAPSVNISVENRPLQQVFPVPTSDPTRFDAGLGSIISAQGDSSSRSRPIPVPIQQPKPIAPVSSKVFDAVDSDPNYPRRSSSGKTLAEAAIAGVAGAALANALSNDREDDRKKHREGRRERDGKRRSSQYGIDVLDDKKEKRRSRDEDRDDRSDKHREKDSDAGREYSERDRHRREKYRGDVYGYATEFRDRPRDVKDAQADMVHEYEREKRRREKHRDDPAADERESRDRPVDERKEDRKDDCKESRREKRRGEKRASQPSDIDAYRRVEDPNFPTSKSPIDPFQFQVADDAFATPTYTTPNRPLTPTVVTVEREPDFSNFDPSKYADDFKPPERTGRRDSYERELRDANDVYEQTRHSTVSIEASAIAASVPAVANGERGRSRSRRGDSSSRTRSRQKSPTQDEVLQKADERHREQVTARRVAEARPRSQSPEQSVLDKWKDGQELTEPRIEIVKPPEEEHPKTKSPYDAPDADVRIDNVFSPKELLRYNFPENLVRDPSAERHRPVLNLVRPTPVPSPMPERQKTEVQSPPEDKRKPKIDLSKSTHDVVIGPRGEVVQPPSTLKAVSWGENSTNHYVIETSDREDEASRAKVVTPAETPKFRSSRPGKKSGWGVIAAAVSGAAAGAASGISDSAKEEDAESRSRDSPKRKGKRRSSVPFDEFDEPPIPGPKPLSPRSHQMPGSFAEDLDFTATVAAGLQDTGFDPNIVINDATYHRRDSPPGTNNIGAYHAPFAETVSELGIFGVEGSFTSTKDSGQGFVIGELPVTPADEKDIPADLSDLSALTKKERRKREKEAKRSSVDKIQSVVTEEPKKEVAVLEAEASGTVIQDNDWGKLSKKERKRRGKVAKASAWEDDEVIELPSSKEPEFVQTGGVDEWDDTSSKKKKSKKSKKKAIIVQDNGKEFDDVESSRVSIPVDSFNDIQDAPSVLPQDEWDLPKKNKKMSKRDSDVDNLPSQLAPSEVSVRSAPTEIPLESSKGDNEWDKPKKSKKNSKRDTIATDTVSLSAPVSEAGETSNRRHTMDDFAMPTAADALDKWNVPNKPEKISKRDSTVGDDVLKSSKDMTDSVSDLRNEKGFFPEDECKVPWKCRKSKGESRNTSPARSDPEVSEKKSKKEKRWSAPGGFTEDGNVLDEGEPPDRGKHVFQFQENDVSSVVSDPTRHCRSDRSRSRGRFDDLDETKSVASAPGGSDWKDRNSNSKYSNKDKRDSAGPGFFDRFKSSIGIVDEKDRSRKSDEDKKQSFLDNADTLGAGVGMAVAVAALTSQMARQNATDAPLEKEAPSHNTPTTRELRSSPPRQISDVTVDPEIVQREIRPAIDPQYGDLLPLPPSTPGSPKSETVELPALPDSRPETPDDERLLRRELFRQPTKPTHVHRRNAFETPIKSPSTSAIPIQFRLGQRSSPASPGSRDRRASAAPSPVASPATGASEFVSVPKIRAPRPSSWDSTKDYKPLYLVEKTSRTSSGFLMEPEENLPALPPSGPPSRESPGPEFENREDDVQYLGHAHSLSNDAPLQVDVHTAITGFDSQEDTPKADYFTSRSEDVFGVLPSNDPVNEIGLNANESPALASLQNELRFILNEERADADAINHPKSPKFLENVTACNVGFPEPYSSEPLSKNRRSLPSSPIGSLTQSTNDKVSDLTKAPDVDLSKSLGTSYLAGSFPQEDQPPNFDFTTSKKSKKAKKGKKGKSIDLGDMQLPSTTDNVTIEQGRYSSRDLVEPTSSSQSVKQPTFSTQGTEESSSETRVVEDDFFPATTSMKGKKKKRQSQILDWKPDVAQDDSSMLISSEPVVSQPLKSGTEKRLLEVSQDILELATSEQVIPDDFAPATASKKSKKKKRQSLQSDPEPEEASEPKVSASEALSTGDGSFQPRSVNEPSIMNNPELPTTEVLVEPNDVVLPIEKSHSVTEEDLNSQALGRSSGVSMKGKKKRSSKSFSWDAEEPESILAATQVESESTDLTKSEDLSASTANLQDVLGNLQSLVSPPRDVTDEPQPSIEKTVEEAQFTAKKSKKKKLNKFQTWDPDFEDGQGKRRPLRPLSVEQSLSTSQEGTDSESLPLAGLAKYVINDMKSPSPTKPTPSSGPGGWVDTPATADLHGIDDGYIPSSPTLNRYDSNEVISEKKSYFPSALSMPPGVAAVGAYYGRNSETSDEPAKAGIETLSGEFGPAHDMADIGSPGPLSVPLGKSTIGLDNDVVQPSTDPTGHEIRRDSMDVDKIEQVGITAPATMGEAPVQPKEPSGEQLNPGDRDPHTGPLPSSRIEDKSGDELAQPLVTGLNDGSSSNDTVVLPSDVDIAPDQLVGDQTNESTKWEQEPRGKKGKKKKKNRRGAFFDWETDQQISNDSVSTVKEQSSQSVDQGEQPLSKNLDLGEQPLSHSVSPEEEPRDSQSQSDVLAMPHQLASEASAENLWFVPSKSEKKANEGRKGRQASQSWDDSTEVSQAGDQPLEKASVSAESNEFLQGSEVSTEPSTSTNWADEMERGVEKPSGPIFTTGKKSKKEKKKNGGSIQNETESSENPAQHSACFESSPRMSLDSTLTSDPTSDVAEEPSNDQFESGMDVLDSRAESEATLLFIHDKSQEVLGSGAKDQHIEPQEDQWANFSIKKSKKGKKKHRKSVTFDESLESPMEFLPDNPVNTLGNGLTDEPLTFSDDKKESGILSDNLSDNQSSNPKISETSCGPLNHTQVPFDQVEGSQFLDDQKDASSADVPLESTQEVKQPRELAEPLLPRGSELIQEFGVSSSQINEPASDAQHDVLSVPSEPLVDDESRLESSVSQDLAPVSAEEEFPIVVKKGKKDKKKRKSKLQDLTEPTESFSTTLTHQEEVLLDLSASGNANNSRDDDEPGRCLSNAAAIGVEETNNISKINADSDGFSSHKLKGEEKKGGSEQELEVPPPSQAGTPSQDPPNVPSTNFRSSTNTTASESQDLESTVQPIEPQVDEWASFPTNFLTKKSKKDKKKKRDSQIRDMEPSQQSSDMPTDVRDPVSLPLQPLDTQDNESAGFSSKKSKKDKKKRGSQVEMPFSSTISSEELPSENPFSPSQEHCISADMVHEEIQPSSDQALSMEESIDNFTILDELTRGFEQSESSHEPFTQVGQAVESSSLPQEIRPASPAPVNELTNQSRADELGSTQDALAAPEEFSECSMPSSSKPKKDEKNRGSQVISEDATAGLTEGLSTPAIESQASDLDRSQLKMSIPIMDRALEGVSSDPVEDKTAGTLTDPDTFITKSNMAWEEEMPQGQLQAVNKSADQSDLLIASESQADQPSDMDEPTTTSVEEGNEQADIETSVPRESSKDDDDWTSFAPTKKSKKDKKKKRANMSWDDTVSQEQTSSIDKSEILSSETTSDPASFGSILESSKNDGFSGFSSARKSKKDKRKKRNSSTWEPEAELGAAPMSESSLQQDLHPEVLSGGDSVYTKTGLAIAEGLSTQLATEAIPENHPIEANQRNSGSLQAPKGTSLTEEGISTSLDNDWQIDMVAGVDDTYQSFTNLSSIEQEQPNSEQDLLEPQIAVPSIPKEQVASQESGQLQQPEIQDQPASKQEFFVTKMSEKDKEKKPQSQSGWELKPVAATSIKESQKIESSLTEPSWTVPHEPLSHDIQPAAKATELLSPEVPFPHEPISRDSQSTIDENATAPKDENLEDTFPKFFSSKKSKKDKKKKRASQALDREAEASGITPLDETKSSDLPPEAEITPSELTLAQSEPSVTNDVSTIQTTANSEEIYPKFVSSKKSKKEKRKSKKLVAEAQSEFQIEEQKGATDSIPEQDVSAISLSGQLPQTFNTEDISLESRELDINSQTNDFADPQLDLPTSIQPEASSRLELPTSADDEITAGLAECRDILPSTEEQPNLAQIEVADSVPVVDTTVDSPLPSSDRPEFSSKKSKKDKKRARKAQAVGSFDWDNNEAATSQSQSEVQQSEVDPKTAFATEDAAELSEAVSTILAETKTHQGSDLAAALVTEAQTKISGDQLLGTGAIEQEVSTPKEDEDFFPLVRKKSKKDKKRRKSTMQTDSEPVSGTQAPNNQEPILPDTLPAAETSDHIHSDNISREPSSTLPTGVAVAEALRAPVSNNDEWPEFSSKKSKKDKKKRKSNSQTNSEPPSGTQTPFAEEFQDTTLSGDLDVTTVTDTFSDPISRGESIAPVSTDDEWPEFLTTKKSKKDKKKKKTVTQADFGQTSPTQPPFSEATDMQDSWTGNIATSEPANFESGTKVEAPSSLPENDEWSGFIAKKSKNDQKRKSQGSGSIITPLETLPPNSEGARESIDPSLVTEPVSIKDKDIWDDDNFFKPQPASKDGTPRPSSPLNIEAELPTVLSRETEIFETTEPFRERTPSPGLSPSFNIDLSPAQLSSHIDHDRPFDQSTQPGKKARMKSFLDDTVIPEPISATREIAASYLEDPNQATHGASETVVSPVSKVVLGDNFQESDSATNPSMAREFAASYLESQPSQRDAQRSGEQLEQLQAVTPPGDDIMPNRVFAVSYLESKPKNLKKIPPSDEQVLGVEKTDLSAMTPHREIAASYFDPQPTIHKSSSINTNEKQLSQVSSSVREVAASFTESLPSKGKGVEIASDSKDDTIENQQKNLKDEVTLAAATVTTGGVAALAQKFGGSTKKVKKGKKKISKYVDKRTSQGADLFDDPSLWEASESKPLEGDGGRLKADSGDFWDVPDEVIEEPKLEVPSSERVQGNLSEKQQARQEVTMDSLESPIVGREVTSYIDEPKNLTKNEIAGPEDSIARSPPNSQLLRDIDELDASEPAPERQRELDSISRGLHDQTGALSSAHDMDFGRVSTPQSLPPVEEEAHEDLDEDVLLKPWAHKAPHIPEINRDSGFIPDSPHPLRRSMAADGQRDSGVHMKDWPESVTKKRGGLSPFDETGARLSWDPVDERGDARENQTPKSERRSKKSPLSEGTSRLSTPTLRSQQDMPSESGRQDELQTTHPQKPKSSKYQSINNSSIALDLAPSAQPQQQRSVSDSISREGTPRQEHQPRRVASNTSISRLKTPEPLKLRPDSPGSALSSLSNLSARSHTPPLRRVDKRMSGDLRTLSHSGSHTSLLSKEEQSKHPNHAAVDSREAERYRSALNTTPVANEGRVRVKDMTDVYDGIGEGRIGSPRSPTRPHSMRRRQSMQVLELESKVEQLIAENRMLADARLQAEWNSNQRAAATISERDAVIEQLRASLDWMKKEVQRLTEVNDGLNSANAQLAHQHNEKYGRLEIQHASASQELEQYRGARGQYTRTLQEKDAEIEQLRQELEVTKEQVRDIQRQILANKPADADFLRLKDEDHFDHRCQQLCAHVQQWVLRFSKFSDMRACRLASEINDEKIIDRLDNSVLDGSDVDDYLSDRVKRRDIFMSMSMNMIWEFVFTRYLFGMDREQRQKLKSLEKLLSEVGPPQAVRQWRAVTLTLLSKRPAFGNQRNDDTEAVVQAIIQTLSMILPPPSNMESQIISQLRKVMREAVDLSIEMRTQRAEYMMLPPLQPEYDANGDLAGTVEFNASLMNERSGGPLSNEDLEAQGAIVRSVLFPLVVKKGNDNGVGDDEIVVWPAQVLVATPGRSSICMVTPSSDVGGAPVSRGATPSVMSKSAMSLPMSPPGGQPEAEYLEGGI